MGRAASSGIQDARWDGNIAAHEVPDALAPLNDCIAVTIT
jgi:hypothetical protein